MFITLNIINNNNIGLTKKAVNMTKITKIISKDNSSNEKIDFPINSETVLFDDNGNHYFCSESIEEVKMKIISAIKTGSIL